MCKNVSEELGFSEYVRKKDEWMLKVVAEGMEEGELKLEFEKRKADEGVERLMAKKLHGKFFKDVGDVAGEMSWEWLRRDIC